LQTSDQLTLLSPIYEYLANLGYEPKGEFVYIEDLPVQFLPVFNSLTREAVARAQTIKFGRTIMFLEQHKVNRRALQAVLRRHNLSKKWRENSYRFEP
jgi:hypothetical protein